MGVLLHFHKRTNLCLIADSAAIQVDEIRVMDHDVSAQLHGRGHRHHQPFDGGGCFSSTSTRPLLPQSILASRSGRDRQPSSTNISRSMSLFSSVMCDGSTSNCVVKSSRLAGAGWKRVVT